MTNTLRPSNPIDLYGEGRQDIYNRESDLNSLEDKLKLYENNEVLPPVPGAPTPDDVGMAMSEAPSQLAIEEEEKKGMLEHAGEMFTFLTKPLTVFGAGLAPLAHDYESEGFWGQTGEAFQVMGQDIKNRLFPEYGEVEAHGQEVMGRIAPNAPPWVKSSGGFALEMITDPMVPLGLGTIKSVQAGMKVGRMMDVAKKGTPSTGGVISDGVQEILNVGKGFDPAEVTEIGKLAKVADKGGEEGKKALQELDQKLKGSPEFMAAVKKTDDKDVRTLAKDQQAILGSPKKEAYSIRNKIDGVESLPDADFKRTLSSDIQYRSMDINIGAINSLDDVDKLVTDATKVYSTEYEKAMSVSGQGLAEATRLQNAMLTDIVGRKTVSFAPDQAYGLRQLLIATGNQLKKRSIIAEQSTNKLHDVAFEKAAAIQEAIINVATGVANPRTEKLIQAYSTTAKSTRKQVRDVENIVTSMAATKRGSRLQKTMIRTADDPRKINRAMEKKPWDKAADVAYEVFTNFILSGPLTHAKNITTNGFLVALRPTEKLIAGMSATARLNFKEAHADFKETGAMVSAVLETIGDSLRLTHYGNEMAVGTPEVLERAHELAKQKLRPALSSEALGAQGKLGQAIDYVGSGLRIPGNTLLAEDKAFKVLNYRMTVNAEAARSAVMSGVTNADRHSIYTTLKYNPNEYVVKKAVDMANYYTFTNELGATGQKFSRIVHLPVLRYVVPFFKSPINIAKVGIRHSVVGNMVKDLPNAYKLDASGDMARAKIALGTLAPAALLMGLNENITGHIDQSTAKGRFQVQNQQLPYSAKLDGTWYSFEGIEPIRSVIGLLISAKEIFENIEFTDPETGEPNPMLEEVLLAAVGPFIKTAGDNFMVPALGKINLMLDGMASGNPAYAINQFKKTMAAMTVPNAMRQFNQQYMDSSYRRSQGYLEMVKQGVPGLSKTLPPVYTLWGDEVVVPDGLGIDLLSPVRTATRDPDFIDNEIIRLEVPIPSRPKSITPVDGGPSVPLNPQQQAKFALLRGKGFEGRPPLKEMIHEFTGNPEYMILPDKVKRETLQYMINVSTESTKAYLFGKSIELQEEYKNRLEAAERSYQTLKAVSP